MRFATPPLISDSGIRNACVSPSASTSPATKMRPMSSGTLSTVGHVRASQTSETRGRKPRTRETRVRVQTKLPESTFEEIFTQVKSELGLSQSDFVAIATIRAANELRAERGLELLEMPAYLVEALEGGPTDNPLQEALLEAS